MTTDSFLLVRFVLSINCHTSYLLTTFPIHSDPKSPSTKGSDFYVAFFPNTVDMNESQPLYQILISTDEPEPVTFTVSLSENLPEAMRRGFPFTGSVSYGDVYTATFHQNMAVHSSTNQIEQYKAIRIQTQGGKKITVQGFNDNIRTSDGFIAFPCDSMTNEVFTHYEYFVLAADHSPSANHPPKNSFAIIVPCYNNTVISVEPSQIVNFSGLDSLPTPPTALEAGPGAPVELTTFTANEGQTLLISHPGDLSGTIIQSISPIVLLSGHECGEIPLGMSGCDHMVEQMPPGLAFGTRFFLVPLAGRVSGDFYRVGTLTNGTRVTVTCINSSHEQPRSFQLENGGVINRGDFLNFMTPGNVKNQLNWKPSYCCLQTTNPVLVSQYSTSYSNDNTLTGKDNIDIGDPFMTIVPPVTQYLNNYTMTSLVGASGPFLFRYMSLSIAAQFFDNSAQDRQKVKLNDETVKPINSWVPIYCSGSEICGYGAQVEVPRGDIGVLHEDPEVGIGVSYYAFQQHNSYSILQGYELTPIAGKVSIIATVELNAIPICM